MHVSYMPLVGFLCAKTTLTLHTLNECVWNKIMSSAHVITEKCHCFECNITSCSSASEKHKKRVYSLLHQFHVKGTAVRGQLQRGNKENDELNQFTFQLSHHKSQTLQTYHVSMPGLSNANTCSTRHNQSLLTRTILNAALDSYKDFQHYMTACLLPSTHHNISQNI
jgi:hypothetical protein